MRGDIHDGWRKAEANPGCWASSSGPGSTISGRWARGLPNSSRTRRREWISARSFSGITRPTSQAAARSTFSAGASRKASTATCWGARVRSNSSCNVRPRRGPMNGNRAGVGPDELESWTWGEESGEGPMTVRAYTSGDEVRLLLNGSEFGRKSVATPGDSGRRQASTSCLHPAS